MKPSDLHRIADSTVGARRFYESEQARCLRYTNALYGKVCNPKEAFIKEFTAAFHEVVARTHAVGYCRAEGRGLTLQFPILPPMPNYSHLRPGEIVIHLPESRDAWASNFRDAVHRDFPWVQWRRPGDSMVFRRRQISPRETPAQIFARCSRYFEVHALAIAKQHAA
jgi:hypothetical protein